MVRYVQTVNEMGDCIEKAYAEPTLIAYKLQKNCVTYDDSWCQYLVKTMLTLQKALQQVLCG